MGIKCESTKKSLNTGIAMNAGIQVVLCVIVGLIRKLRPAMVEMRIIETVSAVAAATSDSAGQTWQDHWSSGLRRLH